ncbi:hypothetical protein ACIGD1_18005 [Streptomyces sp. NPDC085612]|uniref:hypothetical protein n=1 Tax=Streptomyces sp. NPDC085612 TaxID=3365732 RepID=UPI0037D5D6A3
MDSVRRPHLPPPVPENPEAVTPDLPPTGPEAPDLPGVRGPEAERHGDPERTGPQDQERDQDQDQDHREGRTQEPPD